MAFQHLAERYQHEAALTSEQLEQLKKDLASLNEQARNEHKELNARMAELRRQNTQAQDDLTTAQSQLDLYRGTSEGLKIICNGCHGNLTAMINN